jgi:hypothetical protein
LAARVEPLQSQRRVFRDRPGCEREFMSERPWVSWFQEAAYDRDELASLGDDPTVLVE